MDQAATSERGVEIITAAGAEDNHTPHNGYAKSAYVCGIIAVSLNLLVFTSVVGIILSIISITFGAITYRQSSYGKAGFVLGLLSVFVIISYVLSAIVLKVADPFL